MKKFLVTASFKECEREYHPSRGERSVHTFEEWPHEERDDLISLHFHRGDIEDFFDDPGLGAYAGIKIQPLPVETEVEEPDHSF